MCKQSDAVTLAARCERAVLRSTEERSQIHVREEALLDGAYLVESEGRYAGHLVVERMVGDVDGPCDG